MTELEMPEQDELTTLKARAELMGISHHPSIGLEKLRAKINDKLDSVPKVKPKEIPNKVSTKAPIEYEKQEETLNAKRIRINLESTALVRIRLTCMNPAKKEWDGEIFTVGNSAIGSMKKFVPFNADEGWHVPNIMLQALRDRQCQVFTTERSKNGVSVRKGKLIKEFNIEILDPLTRPELNELARRQAMAAGAE